MAVKLFYKILIIILAVPIFIACNKKSSKQEQEKESMDTISEILEEPLEIIDSDFSFEEAVAGTKAPKHILDQITLIGVRYLSTDGKIHKGQILVNQKIAKETEAIFKFMLENKFVIHQVVPIVKYNWDDNLSMKANNSYGFCYRDIMNSNKKSKHSLGMAIDINPIFNPIRWKSPNKHRPNIPDGAVHDTTVNGTLYSGHPVVNEMKRLGFRWGNQFKKYSDDHHFEK